MSACFVLTLIDVSQARRGGVRGDGRVVRGGVLRCTEGHSVSVLVGVVEVEEERLLTVRSEPEPLSRWVGTSWRSTAAERSFAVR